MPWSDYIQGKEWQLIYSFLEMFYLILFYLLITSMILRFHYNITKMIRWVGVGWPLYTAVGPTIVYKGAIFNVLSSRMGYIFKPRRDVRNFCQAILKLFSKGPWNCDSYIIFQPNPGNVLLCFNTMLIQKIKENYWIFHWI